MTAKPDTHRARIVALAGTLCSPRIFDPLVRRLSMIATVDAVSWMTSPGPWDLPSLAEWLARGIVGEGDAPVMLVGHSTGGAIALQLVLTHPELVGTLVLIDSGPNMHAHADVDAIIRSIDKAWGPALFGSILDRSFQDPLDPSIRREFLNYSNEITRRAALEVLTSQRATDFSESLEQIRCPVLVLHGINDPTRTVAQAEHFAGQIRGARLQLLNCGHSPMFEEPDQVARAVLPLLSVASSG